MFMQNAKAFHAAEKSAYALHGLTVTPDFGAEGMLAASLVETSDGWKPAGTLGRGARVQTWDGGLCAVTQVARRHLWPAAGAELVHVPGGVLDSCSDLWLMPGQAVLIAQRVVEEVLEAAAALVPARDLAGFRGISLRPLARPVELISLSFATTEVVYVNSGAMIYCPSAAHPAAPSDYYPRLDRERAKAMLALIGDGGLSTADLRCAA